MAWVQHQTLKSHAKAPELLAPKQALKNDAPLSFYDGAPTAEVSILEFETFALDRLRGAPASPPYPLAARAAARRARVLAVLKGAEQAKGLGKKDAELDSVTRGLCQKHLRVRAPCLPCSPSAERTAIKSCTCGQTMHHCYLVTSGT